MPTPAEPGGAVPFTAPGFDVVHDLHGDVARPDLVVFMGGNEFMLLPDLLPAFLADAPACARIFVETLPPGILEQQLRRGGLQVGALRIDHPPDVFTAGHDRVERLERDGLVRRKAAYASNQLAIMVRDGNPLNIRRLVDLGRDDVRVATPDPSVEDIGNKAEEALRRAGGDTLVRVVTVTKVARGATHVTRIHHRETPQRILDGSSDAGVVWATEIAHQRAVGRPIEGVPLADAPRSMSFAVVLARAPHRRCAEAFVAFLASPRAREVLARHGFDPPEATP